MGKPVTRLRPWINGLDLERLRSVVQILSFVFLLYGGYLAVDLSSSLPTFACAFVESRGGTCYLYPLQHQANIPVDQILTGRGMGVLTSFLTFLLFFVFLNKGWCGFLCPLGTVQDWITGMRRQLGIRPSSYRRVTFRRLGWIKYGLLLLLLVLPLGMSNALPGLPKLSSEFATPFCLLCPGRTVLPLLSLGDLSQLSLDLGSWPKAVLTALGLLFTGVFLAGALVKKRFACLFCPMSALQYLVSKVAFFRLRKDGGTCSRCGNCLRVCDMGIVAIAEDCTHKNILQADCMLCLKCVGACPEERCLEATVLGWPVYQSTGAGFHRRLARKMADWADHER
ncbi:MAG: 4Fe-4S binding protein [Thermodesulfobacteriota bacterium]